MKSTRLTVGLMIGLITGWAIVAQALDTGWFRNPSPQPGAAQPTAIPPQSQGVQQLIGNTQVEIFKNQLECQATPNCGNGYTLTKDPCPNQLPGKIPSTSYPVKGCYTCTVPSKVAVISKDEMCLAEGYEMAGFISSQDVENENFPRWGIGTFTCMASKYKSPPPTSFVQLCPSGTGAENFKTGPNSYYAYGVIYHGYDCRFAAANAAICKQCGAITVPAGPNGEVYCVLPSNLPPADPNKPCGK